MSTWGLGDLVMIGVVVGGLLVGLVVIMGGVFRMGSLCSRDEEKAHAEWLLLKAGLVRPQEGAPTASGTEEGAIGA